LKLAALCDIDTAVGLRLAGVHEVHVVKDRNAVELWNQISNIEDIGIIFITEEIAESLDKYLKDFRIRNNLPIIVEIPDKKGRRKDHVDFVSHLIKKAVGIEVNR
jgi:V/A-type H+-transporting ATPase subunit F